jgi:hypothetical protein
MHELGHSFNLQHSNAAERECKCTQRGIPPVRAVRPRVRNVLHVLDRPQPYLLTLELDPPLCT